MNEYFGAPAAGQEWTIEDVFALQPGELPPWNPDGIRLDPGGFDTRQEFENARNNLIDESGYRKLYDQWKKGRPGTYHHYQTVQAENKNRNRLLLTAGAIAAAFFLLG